ncbi:MAG: hypothetical protein HY834_18980 [Devosia nanyangense]|uniref:Uncharacterized protein n=1 Tax=Devosia nanyangense TaxID=1228055 RepID=A0A933P0N8_9HYPH|nr:hypothetical protein [Devosia nanyangense]
MRLNSKITWGLAWTGLAVVLAVPSADFLTGRIGDNKAAVLTSTTEPVKTASVTTTKTATGVIITPAGAPLPVDPVEKLLGTGKVLPDYISGETSGAAKLSATSETTQVASIDPVAPMPFPSWARPLGASKPATPVAPATTQPPVIVDEAALATREASIDATPAAVPPANIVDDSANWDTETLRQYLERRGILEGGDTADASSATVTVETTSGTYDPDGFYLSDGPNDSRAARRARLLWLLEHDGDTADFPLF